MNIYMRIQGQGHPLIMLHGFGFDSHVWSLIVSELSAHYQLYLVDLPGFGNTPYCTWAEFKHELLGKLPEQFAILGWSLGGMFATKLALEHIKRVTHVINVASSPYFIKQTTWPGIPQTVLMQFANEIANTPLQALKQFVKIQARNTMVDSVLPHRDPSAQGLHSGLEYISTWDLRDALLDYKKPICYMFGRLDAIVPVQTFNVMAQTYPHIHTILFRRAAHMPFLSHPKEFMSAIREFLL